MSKYFDVFTGDVREYTLYPTRLDFYITSNWYPLYDHDNMYTGAVIDNEFMPIGDIRKKWGKFE